MSLKVKTLVLVCLTACITNTMFAQEQTLPVTATPSNDSLPLPASTAESNDTVSLRPVKFLPYISVQQMLKGNAAGVFVHEPSGEPGVEQNMFIHGISAPKAGSW